jgi:hypothetical protein
MAHRDFLLQVLSLILRVMISHQATSLFLAQVHLVPEPVPSLSTVRLLSVVQTPSLSVLAPQHLEAHLLSQETKPILLTSQSTAETSRPQPRHLTSSMAQPRLSTIGGAATTINLGAAGAVVTGGGALTLNSGAATASDSRLWYDWCSQYWFMSQCQDYHYW